MRIAYFITSHGYGHASRAAAVMSALHRCAPDVEFDIFTTCPRQIFHESLQAPFSYHNVLTDIGMVQRTPLHMDLSATCQALNKLLPFKSRLLKDLARRINRKNCSLVICDIAAMGIAAARQAGLAAVLIENFTWDWIYEAYTSKQSGLRPHIDYLKHLYRLADFHIQTEPFCQPVAETVRVAPISRRPRTEAIKTRQKLGVSQNEKMVLVSMGGVPDAFDFLHTLAGKIPATLVIPGSNNHTVSHPQVILLPKHSDFYHPDLIGAADALIGKAGYSTIAEAYSAGLPYGYICRNDSPESSVLEAFLTTRQPSLSISEHDYTSGNWIRHLPELLNLSRARPQVKDGAETAASLIAENYFK
ncbi:MAG: hypothetical protein GY874_06810 [Desulfobacteraceae bacterium]|nr:hypothetical protein [Desulfobacteraceae bacterium]